MKKLFRYFRSQLKPTNLIEVSLRFGEAVQFARDMLDYARKRKEGNFDEVMQDMYRKLPAWEQAQQACEYLSLLPRICDTVLGNRAPDGI